MRGRRPRGQGATTISAWLPPAPRKGSAYFWRLRKLYFKGERGLSSREDSPLLTSGHVKLSAPHRDVVPRAEAVRPQEALDHLVDVAPVQPAEIRVPLAAVDLGGGEAEQVLVQREQPLLVADVLPLVDPDAALIAAGELDGRLHEGVVAAALDRADGGVSVPVRLAHQDGPVERPREVLRLAVGEVGRRAALGNDADGEAPRAQACRHPGVGDPVLDRLDAARVAHRQDL